MSAKVCICLKFISSIFESIWFWAFILDVEHFIGKHQPTFFAWPFNHICFIILDWKLEPLPGYTSKKLAVYIWNIRYFFVLINVIKFSLSRIWGPKFYILGIHSCKTCDITDFPECQDPIFVQTIPRRPTYTNVLSVFVFWERWM